MNVVPLQISRVTDQMQGSLLEGMLQSDQMALLKVQTQISTGQRLNLPSDDPAAAVGIQQLNQELATNSQYTTNLNFAQSFLSTADSTLGSLTSLLNQAQSIASSQAGSDATPDQRKSEASVIDSLVSQAISFANTRYQGQSVFGGQNGTQDVFASTSGGYVFQGSAQQQGILTDTGTNLNYTVDGNQVFGGLSAQVSGYRQLTPALTSTTRLADLGGASGSGIAPGSVLVSDGTTSITVDLSKAATVGDVVNTLNTQMTAAGLNATVSTVGDHLQVATGAGTTLNISDPTTPGTAASLGIAMTTPSGSAMAGSGLAPQITATTTLGALGLDLSGIVITNGTTSATIGLNGLSTVGDLLNKINGSGTHVRAQINAAGNGFDILNTLAGTGLRIGENGGTTADQLGIRSFQGGTPLAQLNSGAGVTPISQTLPGPSGNIIVTKTDGTTFTVKVDGIKTASQLASAINTAAGNGTVTAVVDANTNGLTLTDSSGGAGNLSVAAAPGYVSSGSDLGLFTTGTGATLTGGNVTLSTDDFRITRRDGTSFTVSLQGATTVQDVINAINGADGNASAATPVIASLNSNGNGIRLVDASVGAGTLTVTPVNASSAASQLGFAGAATATTPNVMTGTDVNPVESTGLVSALMLLRDSLNNNDTAGITRAATLLQTANQQVVQAQGTVGAREKDIASRLDQASSDQTQLKSSLSLLADTDMTTAITQYQAMQTAYSAAIQTAQITQNMSLLDFLK